MINNDKKTSWGGVADWYDNLIEKDEDSFQKNVIMPNLMRIVGKVHGQSVADIACGQGYFSKALAGEGARVFGADISSELIEIARKNSPEKIKFVACPADKVSDRLDKESMDLVIIVLALQNIEKMPETIAECSKILKPGGRLIFVLNHPSFRIAGRSSWEWVKSVAKNMGTIAGATLGDKTFRRVDAYMSDSTSRIDMTPGEKTPNKKIYTTSFHRPLQSYFKALNKHGFAVTRLEEWISHRKSEVGPRQAEEDRARKEIPMFICVEAKKIA